MFGDLELQAAAHIWDFSIIEYSFKNLMSFFDRYYKAKTS